MKVSSLFVKYVMKDSQRFLAGGVTGNEAKQVGNGYWLVCVVDDELYVILEKTGETGYAPQDWFWEGNG